MFSLSLISMIILSKHHFLLPLNVNKDKYKATNPAKTKNYPSNNIILNKKT